MHEANEDDIHDSLSDVYALPQLSKVGGPEIAALHRSQKVGRPRPARANSFRRPRPVTKQNNLVLADG